MKAQSPQVSSLDERVVASTVSHRCTAPLGEDASVSAPAGLTVEERLAEIEGFNTNLSGMVESLVDTILHLRNHDLHKLQGRVAALEQELHVERCNRELAEVSRLHPKERIVVFVGGTYFGDNIKYAWLAACKSDDALGAELWFLPSNADQEAQVRSMGGRCLPHTHAEWTPDHLHTALAAAVVVISDHLLGANPYAAALLAGARQVQMWHGVSIKEIGYRNLPPLKHMSPRIARVLRTCGHFARFVGTAARHEPEWRRWFSFDGYAPVGYARNDVLTREPAGHDLLNVDEEAWQRAGEVQARGGRIFLYAPTFRDANRAQWILQVGIERVAKAIADAGDLLIVNMHPVEQPSVPEIAKSLPSVCFVAPRTDVYPLLTRTSVLITDYSSIMFDFLLLDRPVLLFRPDHHDYVTRSRKLFDAKLSVPPGPVATTAQALVDLIRRPAEPATARNARRALRDELHDHQHGGSADRLLSLLTDELAQACAAAEEPA
ncbi:CDP-glycerol glycerophosphotransferase family protein [Rhizobacter sp. LjRoot28]|uniref:CDP-glycerol glycerophosphotransferase family protein n=1 Tax=Rhizobacter sp. LjRoot28 TaxID=3342309 RepID=UPI003ECE6FDB